MGIYGPNKPRSTKPRIMYTTETTRKERLAIVIATKDRPETLGRLLSDIQNQSFRPDQLIVVDGSDNQIAYVLEEFPSLKIDYVRVYPPALTKQKNVGVEHINADITLVGFIDDDIVFEDHAFKVIMDFWETANDDLGGTSFNITTSDPPDTGLRSILKGIFFIANKGYGNVHRSGFNTSIWNATSDLKVSWLGGGYTIWRRQVFEDLRFDEWFPGSGLWEDVLFSFNVGKRYQLSVVAGARAAHIDSPISKLGQIRLGRTQIVNWIHFVATNRELSLPMCLWACIGRLAINLGNGLPAFELNFILRAAGNLCGLTVVAGKSILFITRSNRT